MIAELKDYRNRILDLLLEDKNSKEALNLLTEADQKLNQWMTTLTPGKDDMLYYQVSRILHQVNRWIDSEDEDLQNSLAFIGDEHLLHIIHSRIKDSGLQVNQETVSDLVEYLVREQLRQL